MFEHTFECLAYENRFDASIVVLVSLMNYTLKTMF